MVSHTTWKCDNCGIELDLAEMYDISMNIKEPVEITAEKYKDHKFPFLPARHLGFQLCPRCYKEKMEYIDVYLLLKPTKYYLHK